MSRPSDHLNFQYAELNRLNDTLRSLTRLGILPDNPVYRAVYQARGAALSKIGLNLPRTTTLIKLLAGLSPGELRLFSDAELGWLVEAIEYPGAQPVRRYVSDDIALKIINGEITHELEDELMAPEEPFIA